MFRNLVRQLRSVLDLDDDDRHERYRRDDDRRRAGWHDDDDDERDGDYGRGNRRRDRDDDLFDIG